MSYELDRFWFNRAGLRRDIHFSAFYLRDWFWLVPCIECVWRKLGKDRGFNLYICWLHFGVSFDFVRWTMEDF